MATPAPSTHRRNKSSVLKSIMTPRSHRRAPSDGPALYAAQPDGDGYLYNAPTLMLPPDHPHSHSQTQSSSQSSTRRTQPIPTDPPASPQKSQDATRLSPTKGLNKKTMSAVPLRPTTRDTEKAEGDKAEDGKSREPSRSREDDPTKSPKKAKSSANIVGLFGRNKQSKDLKHLQSPGKDKENTTPPRSANAAGPPRTPIWAEFSSKPLQEITTTSKVPLNDQRLSVEEEIAIYSQGDYSPSKQRNFFDYGQPSLQQKKPQAKERPKSAFVTGSASSTSFFETLTRSRRGDDRVPLGDTRPNGGRVKDSVSSRSITNRSMLRRTNSDKSTKSTMSIRSVKCSEDKGTKKVPETTTTKRQNRVMAAVAAFNGKSKPAAHQTAVPPASPTKLDPKVVDAEFETVLESRNIPNHQRAQMRTLKLEVKADFVRTHKLDTPAGSRATSGHGPAATTAGRPSSKPTISRGAKSQDGSIEDEKVPVESTSGASTKRERPRSRTFYFSKGGDSPIKKQKGDAASTKSLHKSPSSRSLASNSSQRSVSKGSKTVLPDEFIGYLKKTTKPQEVEVGKLHKLRLLLRNETVQWVNQFIEEGGMTELVGLLHRIIEVEWREDHEDTLLHELLRCLKGLCTTDSALQQFAEISSTLFPALLDMLFDEEHKGPSEFTTRELIVQIIFSYLDTAPQAELSTRAAELMKYLKDPVKEKESSTVPFILQMHQTRPYQVWCKEITNVTKEVFWIFIHHLNVVPLPAQSEAPIPFAKAHFPGPRAIVPAAPYVGGVEWDATNYLATHIDLLNGILASLPTCEERNAFRYDLKISGFEKVMGHLRTCNPKYYGAVHDAVKVWIGAAVEDDWQVRDVRMGPPDGKNGVSSPMKQSPAKKQEAPPQIQAPKMDLGSSLGLGFDKDIVGKNALDDDWN
ncbi:hypothetical protein P280DRAFT_516370 [Massarina eburnea CBS 473.64]|uniref:Formin GTPase-binding domain-containing protein n=1 Tax=Massarina eburnea CBS 473.64 TaxID=1395130 RepID=A0A6A6S3V8_9PLEO|nr:hypothetical protein P280DRAFT_516370 [Massarina eburnea CBS 473.64]